MKNFCTFLAFLITACGAQAAQQSKSLQREDLKILATNKPVLKGMVRFEPFDEKAAENIKSALEYMEFPDPALISNEDHIYRFQVNPDSNYKIQEIWLKGYNLSEFKVFFSAPGISRWDYRKNISYPQKMLKTQDRMVKNLFLISLDAPNFSDPDHYTLWRSSNGAYQTSRYGTSAEDFGFAENEHWWRVYITFHPLESEIKTTIVDGKVVHYIIAEENSSNWSNEQGKESYAKSKGLKLTFEKVPVANPFIAQ